MSAPQYWLFTRPDGSITVHRGGCGMAVRSRYRHRRLDDRRLTGPLTAELVTLLPAYRVCRVCMSEKFTLSRAATAARLISRGKD